MAVLIPTFTGSYSGHLINNVANYTVGNSFNTYIESMEIVYDSIHDRKTTGFSDIKYLQNSVSATKYTGSISITLVGSLPHWLMEQLISLAKGCLGSGMILYYVDEYVSDKSYYCKWENAGDFVENNAVLAGGAMLLKFYQTT